MSSPAALIFVLGLLSQSTPSASASVTGVVRDTSGAPVAGAVVRRAADCEATTGADGAFSLDCARPGDRLSVVASGLREATVVVGSGPNDVTLELSSFADAVVVTATRGEGRTTSAAAPVSVLTSGDLAIVPPTPLDDALKVVPGFSLFRRTTSRSANPTTQGAGLRGLSSSGASRALVLADGEVLNDPFGGWVYWNRIPSTAIDRVEVVRGGASDLYGADALAGVVQVVTRRPTEAALRAEASAATHDTGRISLFAGGSHDRWSFSGSGELATTEGYVLVGEDDRGTVDTPAGGSYGVIRADTGYRTGDRFSARIGGDVYNEDRENGTPLQTNDTDLQLLRAALEGRAGRTRWQVTGQGGDQDYHQVFSSIAANRNSETLTIRQHVPADQHAFGVLTETRLGGVDLLAGADTRETSAVNNEIAYFPDGRVRTTTAVNGYQRTSGAYLQLTATPATAVTVSIGARGDVRQGERSQGWLDGDTAFSPRGAVAWALRPSLVARASLGWSFRAPTLNERYRGFRAGNVVTQPNAALVPETLRSVEGALAWLPRAGALRVTVFRNDLDDPVTNVTISSTPDLITRRRRNVGGIVAWGSEVEGEWRVSPRATLTGGMALISSKFVDYAPLEGLAVPQVPHWQGNVGVRGAGPVGSALAAQLRVFGEQYDDDRNTLVLGAGTVVDVSVLRGIGRRTTLFFNLENLIDDQYEVGRSPVATYGQPFTLHGGVRVSLP